MTTNHAYKDYYSLDSKDLVNSFVAHRGSQAPKLQPQERPERKLRVRESVGIKSREQLKLDKSKTFALAVRIAFVSVLCFAMAFFVIHAMAVKNQLTREIAQTQVDIAVEDSNYVSLQSELNAMVSMSTIDKYAVEKLGMTKMRSNQIQYINVDAYKTKQQAAVKTAQKKSTTAPLRDAGKGNNE